MSGRKASVRTTREAPGAAEWRPRHDPVRFQLSEMLSQDFGCHARHRPMKVPEPPRSLTEPTANHRLPSALDDAHRCVDGTAITLDVAVTANTHGCAPFDWVLVSA